MPTKAETVQFGDQKVLIETSPSSGVFEAPCGITQVSMTITTETGTTNVPFCPPDEALASYLEVFEVSKSISWQLQGVLAQQYLPKWSAWALDGGFKTIRYYRNLLVDNGGEYYQVAVLMSNYEESAQIKAPFNVSLTLTANGKPTRVALT